MLKRLKNIANNRGDTMVEVLIAIAVAGIAIGISYSLANRSLQRAIDARERNQALNILDNQVVALKIRRDSDPNFNNLLTSNGFIAGTTGSAAKFYGNSFCLDENAATGRVDNNFPAGEPPSFSNPNVSGATTLLQDATHYSVTCRKTGGSLPTDFFVDIEGRITQRSSLTANPTIYLITVRWQAIGRSGLDSVSISYRL